jgi:hypothetical protein
LEVEAFKEVRPGIYFPVQARQDMFRGGRGQPLFKLSTVRTVVEEVEVNVELPPETFKFEFPVGTQVYDHFLGLGYRTGVTNKHIELSEEYLRNEDIGNALSLNQTSPEQSSLEAQVVPTEARPLLHKQKEDNRLSILSYSHFWIAFLITLLVLLFVIAKVMRWSYKRGTKGQ